MHIVIGPSRCGKLGYVFWRKNHEKDTKLIKIDCVYYHTPYTFVNELIDQLNSHLEKPTKNLASKEKQLQENE